MMKLNRLRKRQTGVVTLVTAVVLMLAVFGVTFFMSEAVLDEQRIVANETRAKEAYHNAQAAVDYGLAYVMNTNVTSFASSSSSPPFKLSITEADDVVKIVGIGSSKDLVSVERTITRELAVLPPTSAPPNVPLISKAAVNLTGSALAINNKSDLTVWAGDEVDTSGNFETRINIDGVDDQTSTTSSTAGPDVVDNDQNLANATDEEFMAAFFNGATSIADLGSSGTGMIDPDTDAVTAMSKSDEDYLYFETRYFNAPAGAADLSGYATSDFILNSSSLAGKDTLDAGTDYDQYILDGGDVFDPSEYGSEYFIGTPDKPVTIIVNGTLKLNSSPIIFGVIVADAIEVNGNPTIYGGMITLSGVSGTGNVTVIMDEIIVGNTAPSDGFGLVSSGWKDF